MKAGEKNEDLIIRRMHQALDPNLAAGVLLKDGFNTVNDFHAKVANIENQAREAYYQTQHRLDEQSSQIKEIRKLIASSAATKKDRDLCNDSYRGRYNP